MEKTFCVILGFTVLIRAAFIAGSKQADGRADISGQRVLEIVGGALIALWGGIGTFRKIHISEKPRVSPADFWQLKGNQVSTARSRALGAVLADGMLQPK
jgi:hypothetical protein